MVSPSVLLSVEVDRVACKLLQAVHVLLKRHQWGVAHMVVDAWRQMQQKRDKATALNAHPAESFDHDVKVSFLEVIAVQVDFMLN